LEEAWTVLDNYPYNFSVYYYQQFKFVFYLLVIKNIPIHKQDYIHDGVARW